MKRPGYIWITLALIALLVPAGYAYVAWSKGGTGAGLYSRLWEPEPVAAYWHPERFYDSVQTVSGSFDGKQCVSCHEGVTPGIVKDWQASLHARRRSHGEPVYCNSCHGSDHSALHMPTPQVCAGCHPGRVAEFEDEKRFGFPSHALAMERAVDAKHFVDKPKAEVQACIQCHSVATKCDSCHTRHKFSAAEARRPEACITCHSGPPHPDDETYFHSLHGQIYLAEGVKWDWSKPLTKGNYRTPTCAYCHMREGKHQVADKTIWKFGLQQVNPLTSSNEVKRRAWIEVCSDCHDAQWSAQQLRGLDAERTRAWSKLYAAEDVLKALRRDDLLHPSAGERPPYATDWLDSLWPRARIGYMEGQSSAFYNVSPIERDYFEMWYFDNLAAYKGAAHSAPEYAAAAHHRLDEDLAALLIAADTLRTLGEAEQERTGGRADPGDFWIDGEYTSYNRVHN